MAVDTRPDRDSNATGGIKPAASRVRARRSRRLRTAGNYLIVLGILTVGFVAYEYWGTGYLTQRAQNSLRNTVAAQGFSDYTLPTPGASGAPAPATQKVRPIPGGALGYIRIPRLHLDMVFVEGATTEPLKKGPGHYEGTPYPGQGGNVAIAGHRTTYLHPFWALNELRKGDRITLETSKGIFVYKVVWLKVTLPTDVSVLAPTAKPSVTLTTCNPRFSARERLDVRAVQISGVGLAAPAPQTEVPHVQSS
jgi:sortase A